MSVTLGPVTVIGEDEETPSEGVVIRFLPFPASAHFFPWWDVTTVACLEELAARDLTGLHVVDFGCGATAILAMAALYFGAAKVTAVEKMPDLVEEARRQIEANGLSGDIEVILAKEAPPCDLMVANLGDAVLVGQHSPSSPHGFGTDSEGGLVAW